ncbi:MAG: hypothetical protein AAB364_00915 [Patescibacteria group bacterium]
MSDNVKELADLYLEARVLQDRVLPLQERKKAGTISVVETELLGELENELRRVIELGKALSS